MKYTLASAAMLAASAMGTSAAAQDDQVNNGGFRVEALAGWDRVDLSLDEDTDFEGNDSGIFYGAAVGYDLPAGPVMVGVEAEVSSSTTGEKETVEDFDVDGSIYDGTISLSDGFNWYLGGRLGVWASESTAFYGKVGYAWTTVDLDATGTVDGVAGSDSADLNFSGFRFGAGVEQKLSNSAYAKIEYRYTDYSEGEVEYQGDTLDFGDALEFVDLERHQVVAGVGFRF
ncbi:outer membrane protein [Qipengyuania gaetbuli]|nr:outer membrane beta-barrel protein [Qipengyuania gaetbuli]